MTNPTTELERVLELVEKATPGPWLQEGRGISAHHHANNPRLEYWVVEEANGDMRREAEQYRPTDNAAAIAAAVNFIREHGPALLEAMRDAERLDYIELAARATPRDGARVTEADRELRERADQMTLRLRQFALIQRRRRYPKNAEFATECAELIAALAAREGGA